MAFCFLRDIENLKFSFSEKATKIWCNHPQGFEVTMQCQNLEADCTNFLWPSQNSWTLPVFHCWKISTEWRTGIFHLCIVLNLFSWADQMIQKYFPVSRRKQNTIHIINVSLVPKEGCNRGHGLSACQLTSHALNYNLSYSSPKCTRKIHRSKMSVPSGIFVFFWKRSKHEKKFKI